MRNNKIANTFRLIERQITPFRVPAVTVFSRKHNPYTVLISCLLSLRTKDKVTAEASGRLFARAQSAYEMIKLPLRQIRRLIYPVGFYRDKAKAILNISKQIADEYKGRVPDTEEALLSFKGVGRKTANLVLGLGFNKPAICVDIHVHRISNRLGWVKTNTPLETEGALMKIVPVKYWIALNTIFVTFGQNICVPVSPFCSKCSVEKLCPKKGVTRCR